MNNTSSKPSTDRLDAGTSTICDDRSCSISEEGMHMPIGYKVKRMMKEKELTSMETRIGWPSLAHGELSFPVEYDGDGSLYMVKLEELVMNYPYKVAKMVDHRKLTKYVGAIYADAIYEFLDANYIVENTHKFKVGDIVWYKRSNHRHNVCRVSALISIAPYTYSWLSKFIPKYELKHLDVAKPELEPDVPKQHPDVPKPEYSWKLLTNINGKNLRAGGRGLAGESEIELIRESSDDECVRYAYAQVQIFILKKQYQELEMRCQTIAIQEWQKWESVFEGWLVPKNAGKWKKTTLWLSEEVKDNLLRNMWRAKTGHDPAWLQIGRGPRREMQIEITELIKLFDVVVKSYYPVGGTPFRLALLEFKLVYSVNTKKLHMTARVFKSILR